MSVPLFSVIVPTYDRPAFLAEALASVAAQTTTFWECVVVDDASPTPVELPIGDERFRLIRHDTNRGPAAARNTGLDAAAGTHVAFLDDDDLYTPDRLSIARDTLTRATVAICASGQTDNDTMSCRQLDGRVHDVILDATTPPVGATAVRRDVCPRFDDSYRTTEDLDWWLRVTATEAVASDRRVGWLWRRPDRERASLGARARLDGSLQLVDQHSAYFAAHPRAAAFRWLRVVRLAHQVGDRSLARRAAVRAVRANPRPKTAARAVRHLVLPALRN